MAPCRAVDLVQPLQEHRWLAEGERLALGVPQRQGRSPSRQLLHQPPLPRGEAVRRGSMAQLVPVQVGGDTLLVPHAFNQRREIANLSGLPEQLAEGGR